MDGGGWRPVSGAIAVAGALQVIFEYFLTAEVAESAEEMPGGGFHHEGAKRTKTQKSGRGWMKEGIDEIFWQQEFGSCLREIFIECDA